MARVAFCQDTLIEYMGFMQMSAVLKEAGHHVEVFFDPQSRSARFFEELRRFSPDVIGFSVLTPSRGWAIAAAERARAETGALTVVGNVDAILNPEDYVNSGAFDLVCIGEGEDALLDLCDRVDRGEEWTSVEGFWAVSRGAVHRNEKRSNLVEMASLPLIDRELYDKYAFFRRSKYLRVYAGRGCPFRCSFCSNPNLTDVYGGKRYFRKRSPQQFVEDIQQLISSRPCRIKRIYIIDEVLWFDRVWLAEFLTLYRDRIGIPFVMNFKFNGGIREEDVRLMGEAGAIACVATETGDESVRKGLLNKPVSNAHILEVAGWMHRHGVSFGSSAFFGLPGQTFEKHLDELRFFRAVNPHYLWTTFFQPYPGVSLTKHPEVVEHMSDQVEFQSTLHHEMPLNIPDRRRLVNLKKVYFWMFRFPILERPLAFLCRFRIPLLFDALFALHFLFVYAKWAEGLSVRQLATHVKNFAMSPALRRVQPLLSSGRPYEPGPAQPTAPSESDEGSAAGTTFVELVARAPRPARSAVAPARGGPPPLDAEAQL